MKKILLAVAVAVPFLALSVPAETFAACSYAYEVKTNYYENDYSREHMHKALKAWKDYKYNTVVYKAKKQVYKAPQRDWYEVSSTKDYWYDRDSRSRYEVTSTNYWTAQDSRNYFNRDYNETSWRSSYRNYLNDQVPVKKATVKKATVKKATVRYSDDYDYDYYDYDYNRNYDDRDERDYNDNYNRNWNRTNYNNNYNNNNDRNYRSDDNYNYNNTYRYEQNRNGDRYWYNDSRFIGG